MSDSFYLGRGQSPNWFVFTAWFSAVCCFVSHIFQASSPAEVSWFVVFRVAIEVAALFSFWPWAGKRKENSMMYAEFFIPDQYMQMSGIDNVRFQYLTAWSTYASLIADPTGPAWY